MEINLLFSNLTKFAIFPCLAEQKIPATKHGFKDAKFGQDAEDFIRKGYNIGVACEKSGIVVIDVDYHDANSTAMDDIEELEGKLNTKLPHTLTQSTPNGNGKHLIFSSRGIINPRGKIGKYCDVKSNGYIMFTPSVVNGKQYKIIDGIDSDGKFIISTLPQPWLDYINRCTFKNQQSSKSNSYVFKKHKQYKNINININKMFRECAFLQHCVDFADILSEPEWFSMISILAQIEDTDELIHEISMPYPAYSYAETQKKIAYAREFGHSQSCRYISGNYPDICSNCIFNRR